MAVPPPSLLRSSASSSLSSLDHSGVGVLVDDGVVLDALGRVGVPQRAERLVVVDVGGADGRDHGGHAVAAKRVLEQPGEHAVAVGHLGGGGALLLLARREVGERGDDAAERRQRAVDLGSLLQTRASVAPVDVARSEPARSTRLIFAAFSISILVSGSKRFCVSMRVKTA